MPSLNLRARLRSQLATSFNAGELHEVHAGIAPCALADKERAATASHQSEISGSVSRHRRWLQAAPLSLLLVAGTLSAADLFGVVFLGNKPVSATNVSLTTNPTKSDEKNPTKSDKKIEPTTSDELGRFSFRGLDPGLYKLSCGGKSIDISIKAGLNNIHCRQ